MNIALRTHDLDEAAKAAAPKSIPLEKGDAVPRTLLRFLTCGSVDDGKSTLIGRLLFEAGAVPDDQIESLDRDSSRHSTTGGRDYALLVDGLAAEREQGITIDVAYRYFSTPRRSFIVADTPGHEQYTRNMATGASNAELAIILIDASKGVLPQTRRHAYIAAMLGIRHVVLAINKMDLVDFSKERFGAIEREALMALAPLGFAGILTLPLAARSGDNIAQPSAAMTWYRGPTLLQHLEQVDIGFEARGPFRFPVQWVNRPDADFRGFSGIVASGTLKTGDRIKVLPSGREADIHRIVTADGDLETAGTGNVPTLVLDREIDVSRGDVIVSANDRLRPVKRLSARLLWMAATRFDAARRLKLKLASTDATVTGIEIQHLVDIHSYEPKSGDQLAINDIARVNVMLDRAIVAADHKESRLLGSFILIDAISGATVALGIVENDAASGTSAATKVSGLWRKFLSPTGERPLRSIVKAITWRITGSVDTFLLSWLFTQSAKLAAAISLAEVLTKLVLYYGHERVWARSTFGLSASLSKDAADSTDGAGI
jgi:sulfate adenylyltransferase large subunit